MLAVFVCVTRAYNNRAGNKVTVGFGFGTCSHMGVLVFLISHPRQKDRVTVGSWTSLVSRGSFPGLQ